MSHRIDPCHLSLIEHALPGFTPASVTPLNGLTGKNLRIESEQGTFLYRPAPDGVIPFVSRLREARIMGKLHQSGLTSRMLVANEAFLLLPWRAGEPLSPADFQRRQSDIMLLVQRLHHQPLTGYRLLLLPLLERYWQQCGQRNPAWQRALRHLRRRGEPEPLRIAPLHMDIHAGNVINDGGELHLIDWEYAADGDVALEVAAICAGDETRAPLWIEHYAQEAKIVPKRLTRQVQRWQPWLRLLMASWYQLRAEQSGDVQTQRLAQQYWQTFI